MQFFLPVLFKIIKARENLSSRNLFVCNSLEVSNIIFFVKIRSNFLQTYMELSLFMYTYL